MKRLATLLIGIGALAALFSAPPASADLTFCSPGSGAGQCERPEGVVVDEDAGRVYVADRGANRISVFKTDGSFVMAFGWGVADGTTKALQTCTVTCFRGIAGNGAGQFEKASKVAIDNSGGPSDGDLYVSDASSRIQKFSPSGAFLLSFGKVGQGECEIGKGALPETPIGVGPGGVVYLADSKPIGPLESEGYVSHLLRYDEAGKCLGEADLLQGPNRFSYAISVEESGNFYLAAAEDQDRIRKYDTNASALCQIAGASNARALGIDGEGHLFASESADGFLALSEYEGLCKTVRRFGYGDVGLGGVERPILGIAPFHSAAGDLFISEEERGVHYLSLPSPGPLALSSTVKAEPVGNIRATLRAKINPEGKATEYHFEYVDDIAFQQNGFSSAKSTPTLSLGAEDFDLHAVEVQLGCTTSPAPDCLQPETTYHFRLIATNSEGKDEVAGEFITKPGLEVLETYATEVGTDAAQIHAEVNPLGIPTTGYFQYVDDATYQVGGFSNATRVPSASAFDFGAGETPLTRSARLDQLAPGTTYHYRLTAEDPLVGEVQGPERTFSTFAALNSGEGGPCPNEGFRTGPAAFLADCRGYEMVSPLDKNNSDIEAPNEFSTHLPAALNQSSLSGERLTYSTSRGFGDAGSAPYSAQYLASRDSGSGWHTHSIVPPRGAPALPGGLQTDTEFKSFSVDLCDAWLRTVADPVLAPGATAGFPNLYRRHDGECGSPGFEALTNAAPPHETRASTYPGLHYSSLELQGVSNDGSKAIYGVFENLTEDAPVQSQTCVNDLEFQSGSTGLECSYRLYAYDASDQSLHYVCVLPGGAPSAQPCSAGTASEPGGRARLNRTENAISDDGTRVFWSASTSTGMGPGKLYVRENPTAEQSEIEAGQCAEVAKACTIAVSKAAEALSGSNSSQYWTAAGDGSKAIFTTGSSLGGGEDLYSFDVDARTTQLIAHQVRGVMGAGGDASYVYFVSSEALDEGATAGKLNLYVAHAGASTYIATLVPGDSSSAHFFSPFEHEPRRLISRVSPDGRHVAFSSLGSLTGYDNADANNGQATAEVYLYDAAANEGAGSLVCASCNPSGGRPVGREVIFGPEKTGYWAAAKIPVWQNSLYAGRQLSDDGIRLYFTSTDALSARDTNGVQDVYQWEAPGSGSCTEAGPAYSVVNRGCVSLISSGKSIDSSEFVEVDPSGRNVFFITLSSLVPQDYGLGDIYDARVDGGFPPPQLPAATCEGEACQGPLSPPNDPTPGSSSFEGAGNVVEKPAKKRHKKHKKKLAKKHHKQTNRNGGKSR